MEFKINIAGKGGKSYKTILKEPDTAKLIGLKIGDVFDGSIIGLIGYEFKITGGSDNAGFPMRKDILGSVRARILTGKSVGLRKLKQKGWRRRKTVRGNAIGEDIAQINVIATKTGKKTLEDLFGKKAEETKEESVEKKEEAPKKTPKKATKKKVVKK
jgi:small subunit ribosomal protein S6e